MKKISATLKGIPLTVHVAASEDERTGGYNLVPIIDGEGMLFEFPLVRWIPINVEGLSGRLDAVGIYRGKVGGSVPRMKDGQLHSVYGEALLELPAGFVEKNGIVNGDKFVRADHEWKREMETSFSEKKVKPKIGKI